MQDCVKGQRMESFLSNLKICTWPVHMFNNFVKSEAILHIFVNRRNLQTFIDITYTDNT
jgi:hypothetical protein